MRKSDVCNLATIAVKDYINKGYILSPTMAGSQGEVLKVDLTLGNEIVRIMITNEHSIYYHKLLVLTIKRYSNNCSTLWNNDGETICCHRYMKVGDNWYIPEMAATDVVKKQMKRCSTDDCGTDKIYRDDRRIKLCLKLIRQIPGHKSTTRKAINFVGKCSTNNKYYVYLNSGQKVFL